MAPLLGTAQVPFRPEEFELEISLEPNSAMALLLDHRKFSSFCGRVWEKGHGCCLGDQGDAKLSWNLCSLSISSGWPFLALALGTLRRVTARLSGVLRIIWALLPSLPGLQSHCQRQHFCQGSFSPAHVVLSEPGQSCQQVTAFTRWFAQHPREAEPLSMPDSTFLFVHPSKETTCETTALSPCQSQALEKSLMYLEKHTVLLCLLWRNLANPS